MAGKYNRALNGNTRTQSGLGRVTDFQPAQADTLILAEVVKVNYIYNTVDLITLKARERLVKGQVGNGKFSAKLPVPFGGAFQTGITYGTHYPIAIGDTVLVGFLDKNKNTPIVIGIYESQAVASELSPTDAISGDPESPSMVQEAMSHFTLFPSQTYREVDGSGYVENTFPGKSFFKLVSGQSGRFNLNDSTYSYSNLSRQKLRGRNVTPTANEAPQILFQHVGAGSRYINNVFFDKDGTFRIAKVTSFDNERIDVQSKSNKDFYFRYQDDSKNPNDDDATTISEVGIKDGVPILRLNEHTLTLNKDKGVLIDGIELKDYVSGSGSDLQKIVDQLVIDMGNVKKSLSEFEVTIRQELANEVADLYTYIDQKVVEQTTDLTALRQSVIDLTELVNTVKATAESTAKTVSDATGSDTSLVARLNRMDNAIADINPYIQEIVNARKDNGTDVTSTTLGARLDTMSKYMRDLDPRILDNASDIQALQTALNSLYSDVEALDPRITKNTTAIATNKTAIAKNATDIATANTHIASNTASVTKALELLNNTVNLTEDQTVAGSKTFESAVNTPALELTNAGLPFIDFHPYGDTGDYVTRIANGKKGLYTKVKETGLSNMVSLTKATKEVPLNIDTMVGGTPHLEGTTTSVTVMSVGTGGGTPLTGTLPTGASFYATLEHMSLGTTSNAIQRFSDTNTGKVYSRGMHSGAWDAWHEIGASASTGGVTIDTEQTITGKKKFTQDVTSALSIIAGARHGFQMPYDLTAYNTVQFPLSISNGNSSENSLSPMRMLKKGAGSDTSFAFGTGGLNIFGGGGSAGAYMNALMNGTVPSGLATDPATEAGIFSADQNVWIMPGLQDATMIGGNSNYYFNNVGWMGKRINGANTNLVNPTGTWIGPATPIPANANINNYNIPGDYSVNLDATAKTVSNTPTNPSTQTGKAFNMTVTVSNPVGMVYQTLRTCQGWVFERAYYNVAWTPWLATAGIMHTNIKGPWNSTIRLSRSANVVYAQIEGMSGGEVAGGATTEEAIPADYRPVSFTAGVAVKGVIHGYWQAQVLAVLSDGRLKNYGGGGYSGNGSGSWLVYNQ